MSFETTVGWVVAVVMVVLAIVFGAGIWAGSPVVVDGVLRVATLVTHLIGSLVISAVCGAYIWFMIKESK